MEMDQCGKTQKGQRYVLTERIPRIIAHKKTDSYITDLSRNDGKYYDPSLSKHIT
jgi:hypothetical protein